MHSINKILPYYIFIVQCKHFFFAVFLISHIELLQKGLYLIFEIAFLILFAENNIDVNDIVVQKR